MKYHERSGSALIITIAITMILMVVAVYLLERIVPMARNVKGIENGNVAYYEAQTALEDALNNMDRSDPSKEPSGNLGSIASLGYDYKTSAVGTSIPVAGQGNSEYSSDGKWNRIGLGQPVQLKLPQTGSDWWSGNVNIYLRVPDIKNGTQVTLSGTTAYVSWILSGNGKTLYSSGSQADGTKINDITADPANIAKAWKLDTLAGIDLGGVPSNFQTFFQTNCLLTSCTLKLGVVNPLVGTTGELIPYLEYRIDFWSTQIPQQYATITAKWYSAGFEQTIQKNIQQLTTNEALDFTIFQ